MSQRVYLGAERVTVSRPGYDAQFPPAIDSRYLALDSRLNLERPLHVGFVPYPVSFNPSNGPTTVYYGASYATPPAVDVFLVGADNAFIAARSHAVRFARNETTFEISSAFGIEPREDSFVFYPLLVLGNPYEGYLTATRLFYYAWKVA